MFLGLPVFRCNISMLLAIAYLNVVFTFPGQLISRHCELDQDWARVINAKIAKLKFTALRTLFADGEAGALKSCF